LPHNVTDAFSESCIAFLDRRRAAAARPSRQARFFAGVLRAGLAADVLSLLAAVLAAAFFAGDLALAALPPAGPIDFLSAAIRSTTLLPRGSELPSSSLSMLSVLPFFLRSMRSLSAST